MINAILTIDDIASKNTPAIVDYLMSKDIHPVMFAVGENVKKYYDEALYVLKNGIVLGNHSYSHPAFSTLTFEEAVSEIEKNEEVLNKLYADAGVERKYRPFRFPYGDKGGEIKGKLQGYFKEKGFDKLKDTQITFPFWKEVGLDKDIDTLWTFDFAEYNIRPGSSFTLDNVWERIHCTNPEQGGVLLEEGSHHFLLLHAHDETEEMVPEYYKLFIERLLENGVTFGVPEFM